MNVYFDKFVNDAKMIAAEKGIVWDAVLDARGKCAKKDRWNLTVLSGAAPPPDLWLSDFSTDSNTAALFESHRSLGPLRSTAKEPLSDGWQELLKACAVDHLFVRGTSAGHIVSILHSIRVLATCASTAEPWKLTPDDIATAVRVCNLLQPSGQLLVVLGGVIKDCLDLNHLVDNAPLSRFLPPKERGQRGRPARFLKSADELRTDLTARKHAEKLPDARAFWELVRIAFTETPKSFLHKLLFAQARVLILTGDRGGESTLLPVDWKRYEEFVDIGGRPAGESGGVSRSLMLRIFREKRRQRKNSAVALVEDVQRVPQMYEDILTTTLDDVAQITAPLRETVKRQTESGRLLPQFKANDLVRAAELYTCLTGNPFAAAVPPDIRQAYIQRYRRDFDPAVFNELRAEVLAKIDANQNVDPALYVYYSRLGKHLPFRRADGAQWDPGSRIDWSMAYLRIEELEECFRRHTPTKLSDLSSITLTAGTLAPWELLFLMPKRALAEGREEGLCDVTCYACVGRMDRQMLTHALSTGGPQTLFSVYGENDEDQALTLNPHSLRHLLNTEYFRLGLSDTIITKHFGRRSAAESHVYDHRSLAEELARIDLPPEQELLLGDKAASVARLIKAGKASGPIVDAYRRIQQSEGEDAAFEYLRVEADGYHATPYGHCVNSFTVDPCPKHLDSLPTRARRLRPA